MKHKLSVKVNKEISTDNPNLQYTPHYKLLKKLKPFSQEKKQQPNKMFEKLRKENRIVDFTLKYLKEKEVKDA
ncbi:hypothetical protein H3N56_11565 [Cetobacterium sp. 2A]|nr:hypothetical protein [Cetobacterium sp. 2A]